MQLLSDILHKDLSYKPVSKNDYVHDYAVDRLGLKADISEDGSGFEDRDLLSR